MSIKRYAQSGFTLAELIVTMTIVAVLATLAVPSFKGWVSDSIIGTQRSDLVLGIRSARHIAINFGTTTTFCARFLTTNECDLNGVGTWDDGWLVVLDKNGNGDLTDDDNNEVKLVGPSNPYTSIVARDVTLRRDVRRITFNPMGQAMGYSAKIIICDAQKEGPARGIEITQTGRTQPYEPASCSGV